MQQLNKEQFNEFQLAVKNGVNPNLLTPDLNAGQMREKRLAIENGLDSSLFTSDISAEKMHSMRVLMQMGVKIDNDFVQAYDEDQLREIQLGEKYNLNTALYQHPFLTASQMKSMRLKLLSEKVVQYIRYQAVNILSKLEEKLAPSKTIEVSKDEQLEAAVLNVLKGLDLKDSATLEQVVEQVSNAMDDKKSIDVNEEDLLVENEKVKSVREYEVLDTYIYTPDISFALLRDKSNHYLIAHKYEENATEITWKDEVQYDDVISAATDYKVLIQEAEKTKQKINDVTKTFSYNEIEGIVLGAYDMYDDAYRLDTLKTNAEDIRDQYLQVISVIDDNPSIRKLASQILKNRIHEKVKNMDTEQVDIEKAETPAHDTSESVVQKESVYSKSNPLRDLSLAQSNETKPAALDYLAHTSTDEKVLSALLQNPNCPNAVMHYLLDHDNANVQVVAREALKEREKSNKFEEIVINKSNVLKEFPTNHEKDSARKPIMLSVIALPQHNTIGLGATIVIPSQFVQSVKDDPNKVKININPERTFDVRCEDKSTILDGKSILKEFKQEKTKSLDKRLAKATEKKAVEKKATTPRKTKSKEKVQDDKQK